MFIFILSANDAFLPVARRVCHIRSIQISDSELVMDGYTSHTSSPALLYRRRYWNVQLLILLKSYYTQNIPEASLTAHITMDELENK
jgi:hypothetical protein